jgi:hypothetical protein
MAEDGRNALIHLPSGAPSRQELPGPENILAGMVTDAVAMARSRKQSETGNVALAEESSEGQGCKAVGKVQFPTNPTITEPKDIQSTHAPANDTKDKTAPVEAPAPSGSNEAHTARAPGSMMQLPTSPAARKRVLQILLALRRMSPQARAQALSQLTQRPPT